MLIGPFFYDGTLYDRRYLNFLTNELPRLLDDVSLDTRERMFFQHDGAPAHNAITVRRFLNQIFPNRWIGTYGVVPWPARSPDFTPLDFFFMGTFEDCGLCRSTCQSSGLKKQNTGGM
jgi:hypothetical protein